MTQKIIYQKGDPFSGEIFVLKEETVKEKRNWVKPLSRLLMVGGFLTIFLLISPILSAEISWKISQLRTQAVFSSQKESRFARVIKESDLEMLKPVNAEFSLIIPKIRLNTQVLAQVPVDDKEVYNEALKEGVAHAKGTYLPGQNGSIYLFGHSSNYLWDWNGAQAVFYLLKELEPGDQLNLFYHGDRYLYQVTKTEIVKADDLSLLKPEEGEEKLILQTCWPLGTNWKRLVVLADRT